MIKFLPLISGACCFLGQIILNYWLTTAFGATVFNQVSIIVITFIALGIGSFFSYKRFLSLRWAHLFLGVFFVFLGMTFPRLPMEVGALFSHFRILGTLLFLFVPMGFFGVLIPRFSDAFEASWGKERGLNRVYIKFHLLAVLFILWGEGALFFWFGIKGMLMGLGGILLILSILVKEEASLQLEKPRLSGDLINSLFSFSLLNGIVQVIIFKTNAHFFGPFPENFSALVAASLLGLSISGLIQEKFRLHWDSYKNKLVVGLALSFLYLFGLTFLSQYVNEFLLTQDLTVIKLGRVVLILLAYLPLYTLMSLLIPVYVSEKKGNIPGALALNAWGNGLGLIVGLGLIGGIVPVKVLIMVSLITYLLVSKNSRYSNLGALGLILLIALVPHKYFHLSYRFFEDPKTFDHYYKSITGVKSSSYLGAQVDVLEMGKTKMLVIDGYKSVKLNQDGKFNKSEILLGSLQGYIGEKRDKALVLGVGSGATVAGNANDYKEVVGVEIHPVILKLQHDFRSYNENLLDKKNVTLVLDDGFNYLLSSEKKFDLITNNVPTPQYSVASQLWTKEFLIEARNRLSDKGFYSQWIDGAINEEAVILILRTLQEVFDHCAFGVVTSTYGNLFCFKEEPQDYYEKIAPISNLLPYRIFPLENFSSLNFGTKVNTLSKPHLKNVLNPYLSQSWRKKKDWFLLDILKVNPTDPDHRLKHCMALEEVKLVKGSSLPDFCQK